MITHYQLFSTDEHSWEGQIAIMSSEDAAKQNEDLKKEGSPLEWRPRKVHTL